MLMDKDERKLVIGFVSAMIIIATLVGVVISVATHFIKKWW